MTTTRLMGSVLGMDREPADSSAETVKATTAQSSTLSVDFPPEIARPIKPEVAPKPVITRQPSVLAPSTQIRTDERSSLQLPAESPGSIELRPCTAATYLLHHETRIGSGIDDDVIPIVDRGVRGYSTLPVEMPTNAAIKPTDSH